MRPSDSIRSKIDRFDLIVLSVLLVLGIATGLLAVRGDQVGLRITELRPRPGSENLSTRTEIRLTFNEPMDRASAEERLRVEPTVEGDVSWRGNTMIWRPRGGFVADTQHIVTLAAGAQSTQGRQTHDDLTWTFRTGRPRVLYMSVGDTAMLYEIDPAKLSTRQLTQFGDGSSIWDYAVSPDGSQIALGLVRPDSSAVDLWLMNVEGGETRQLLACDDSQCASPAWSSDGQRLAYERRELNVDLGSIGGGLGPTRVWLYDLRTGETGPLFDDSQMLGYAPSWSPKGNNLAYFDPQGGVRVVDLDEGDLQLVPNRLGEMGAWSPDGQALALIDMAFVGESYHSYLIRADLKDDTTQNLSSDRTTANEGSPAWSPTGEWIAFGRKALADGTPTQGQQLWLMRPDGSEGHPLLTDPNAHLGSIAWSPDGRQIAYLRLPLMQADARPEIWLVVPDDGVPLKLADRGTLPSWLP